MRCASGTCNAAVSHTLKKNSSQLPVSQIIGPSRKSARLDRTDRTDTQLSVGLPTHSDVGLCLSMPCGGAVTVGALQVQPVGRAVIARRDMTICSKLRYYATHQSINYNYYCTLLLVMDTLLFIPATTRIRRRIAARERTTLRQQRLPKI